MLLLVIEKHIKKAHSDCLKKQWSDAADNVIIADAYCEVLTNWLKNQKDGEQGKFEEVNVKDV
jgi:hypothetical protein